MNCLPIGPEFADLVGQTLTLAEFHQALGIDPPLAPGEDVTWLGLRLEPGPGSTPCSPVTILTGRASRST